MWLLICFCVGVQAPSNHKNVMSAKWGKLSCAILAQDWDAALEELNKLKRDIDETVCLFVCVCACACAFACMCMHVHECVCFF